MAAASPKGSMEFTNGSIRLNGVNSLAVPSAALGVQSDYTIEFELKRSPDAKVSTDDLFIVSNLDDRAKAGLGFKYCPPPYNAGLVYVNGYLTIEKRNFLSDRFDKVTLVAKDGKLTLFRNGLLLAMTDAVKPSALPLTVGQVLKGPVAPYELRNLRVYNTAIFPNGREQPGNGLMRCYSGDNYMMERVEIPDPTLPRILVVGDSISMGYRATITEHFKGRAYVDYWVGGGWIDQNSVRGENSPVKRAWRGVLSNGPYDVVTWNAMTLHMWTPEKPERCPEATYPGNMAEVVQFLKQAAPNTKFIWVRCTPYTTSAEGKPSRIDSKKTERVIRFNTLTDEIMAKYGIPEVDLYGLCEQNLRHAEKDGIHWQPAASRLMGERVVEAIEKSFPAGRLPPSAR
jgi:hypothetical protein